MKLYMLDALALVVAALTAVYVTPQVRPSSSRISASSTWKVDERRMHEEPKPRIGGIAVYLGFAFALFALRWVSRYASRRCSTIRG